MILEIRRTLRHYLDHNLLSCCEWNLLLVQETVTLFMYLCSKGKKVMAQSMSDLGKVTVRKILRQGCLNVWIVLGGGIEWATLQVSHRCLSRDSLAFAALRHEAPRILRWVLLPSAAKKKGLHFSHLHLTLTCHVILIFSGV